jgi:hypothetical protein
LAYANFEFLHGTWNDIVNNKKIKNYYSLLLMKKFLLIFSIVMMCFTNSWCEDIFITKESIILWITQGTTEFLSVSSTKHLILVDQILLSHKYSSSGDVNSLKAHDKNVYFAIIQFESMLVILFLYRHRFVYKFLDLFGSNYYGHTLMINLITLFLLAE